MADNQLFALERGTVMTRRTDLLRRRWLKFGVGGTAALVLGRHGWAKALDAPVRAPPRRSRSVLEWLSAAQRHDVLSNAGRLDLRDALREAILWCAREKVQLDWPAGTYASTHLGKGTPGNSLPLPDGAEVVWRGAGRATRIVRRDASFGPGNFSVMFPLAAMRRCTVGLIDIEGFEVDGNYRGNAGEIRASGHNGEQAAFFRVQTTDPATASVLWVRFDRIHSVDPIADTIALGPSNRVRCWLREALVTNYSCAGRNHLRADIVMGSGAAHVRIEGFRAVDDGLRPSRIESEFSSVPLNGEVPRHELRDIVVGQLEIGGRHRLRVDAEYVETTDYAILSQANVDFRHCKLRSGPFDSRTWTHPNGVIRDSSIQLVVKHDRFFNLNINASATLPQDLEFERVRFELDGTPVADGDQKRLAALRLPPVPSERKRLCLRNCWFDQRLAYSLHAVGYPLIESVGNSLAGDLGFCMKLGVHPTRPGKARLISRGDQLPTGAVLFQLEVGENLADGFSADIA